MRATGTGRAAKAENDQGRREALKRFGKLAAAAPAAMLLLQSRRSLATETPSTDTNCQYPG